MDFSIHCKFYRGTLFFIKDKDLTEAVTFNEAEMSREEFESLKHFAAISFLNFKKVPARLKFRIKQYLIS